MKQNRDYRLYFKTVLLVLDKEREKCSRRRRSYYAEHSISSSDEV